MNGFKHSRLLNILNTEQQFKSHSGLEYELENETYRTLQGLTACDKDCISRKIISTLT